jgi:hypothetical protein
MARSRSRRIRRARLRVQRIGVGGPPARDGLREQVALAREAGVVEAGAAADASSSSEVPVRRA